MQALIEKIQKRIEEQKNIMRTATFTLEADIALEKVSMLDGILSELEKGVSLYVLTGNASDGMRDVLGVYTEEHKADPFVHYDDGMYDNGGDEKADYCDVQANQVLFKFVPKKPRKKKSTIISPLSGETISKGAIETIHNSFTSDQE